MELDPRRLLTFQEVARRRSFSRAAEELSLTQSAVSQQVAALERQLGLQLLHRGRGGVRPTEAGEALLAHAQALADRLDLAAAQLAELAGAERARLRVGSYPSALATVVPAGVARLLERRPGIELQLSERRQEDLPAGVLDGTLHVALLFQDAAAPRREYDGTRRHDLGHEAMALAVGPRHRFARRRTVRLAELAAEPWTAASRDGLIVRACRAAGFEPRLSIVTSDPLAIRAVVAGGLAVTLVPRLLAEQLHGLRFLEVQGATPRRDIYALLPDAGARAVDRELLDELGRGIAAAGAQNPSR